MIIQMLVIDGIKQCLLANVDQVGHFKYEAAIFAEQQIDAAG